MSRSPLIQFRAVPPMDGQIASRDRRGDGPNRVAQRDLTRYYNLIALELRTVAAQLTLGEAALIVDAVRGMFVTDQLIEVRHLDAELADAIAYEDLATKWGVDGDTLLDTVRGWTAGQRLAVVDAAERYWAAANAKPEAELETLLAEVGLLVSPRAKASDG